MFGRAVVVFLCFPVAILVKYCDREAKTACGGPVGGKKADYPIRLSVTLISAVIGSASSIYVRNPLSNAPPCGECVEGSKVLTQGSMHSIITVVARRVRQYPLGSTGTLRFFPSPCASGSPGLVGKIGRGLGPTRRGVPPTPYRERQDDISSWRFLLHDTLCCAGSAMQWLSFR